MVTKQQKFNQIVSDIKSVKIQGARNIAKSALYAYNLIPTEKSKKILLNSRVTEPMLANVLDKMDRSSYKKIIAHFDSAQNSINKNALKLIKNNDIIFTHCHSTNVVNSLIYAKKHKKHFQVYNTETRPLFQGRKTAKQLSKAGIKVSMFVDSAIDSAIPKADKIFLGADALLKNGIINKVGSKMIGELAKLHKVPVYIIADSWKFSKKPVPIEQRKLNEVWDNAPENVKIQNPAFEFVPKKYIKGIITEHGLMSYEGFVKIVGKN